jgi:hypothetical protein
LGVPTSNIYDLPKMHNGELLGLTGFAFFWGYFSVMPWFAFFCGGLLHGRSDIRPKGILPPSSILGLLLMGGSAIAQYYAKMMNPIDDTTSDLFLLNYHLLYPAFCLFALGFCIVSINLFIYVFRKFSNIKLTKFVQTVSANKYSVLFFHMVIGIITLIASNRPFFQKKYILIIYVVCATFLTFYLTVLWRKRVSEKGPMEWLIKRISGSSKT